MRITVFTPTYNRAYIIENLYRSLQRQTFRDFEWLIVDDGSSDNTEEVIAAWQAEGNDFPIRFYKKENGGKCKAINYGVDRAEGLLFFNVDSDDYLLDDALEKVDKWERELPRDGRFCGVVGNLGTSPTETPNTPWPEPYRDATLLERYPDASDRPIDGERAWVFYTEIQKKYKYPEFEGENFITPAVTWNRMANDGYKVRIYDDIIWVYEYQPDGLTASGNKRFLNRPQGHGLWLREMAEFMHYPLKKKMLMWYTYYCDHTFCDEQYRLTKKQCADYIGAPLPFMYLAATVHSASAFLKKLRSGNVHPLLSIQAHGQNFILKHFRHTPYGRYMAKIRNSHLGESCFIIGNGPSLTTEDLSTLHAKGIDTFAVNRIYQIFPQTHWRPTYYVSTDHVMIRDKLEEVNQIPAKIKFIPLQNKYYLGIKVKGAKHFFRNDRREKDPPEKFSLDCTDQVNMRGTVTIACMQLAMHLGYKHIYLLGIDHNFDKIITESGEVIIDPSVKNYFIEGYDDDVLNEVHHDLGNTTRAYYDVRRFIDKTDVRIYNASRQTKLEAFPRVTFEEALAQIQQRKK